MVGLGVKRLVGVGPRRQWGWGFMGCAGGPQATRPHGKSPKATHPRQVTQRELTRGNSPKYIQPNLILFTNLFTKIRQYNEINSPAVHNDSEIEWRCADCADRDFESFGNFIQKATSTYVADLPAIEIVSASKLLNACSKLVHVRE